MPPKIYLVHHHSINIYKFLSDQVWFGQVRMASSEKKGGTGARDGMPNGAGDYSQKKFLSRG